MSKKKRNQPTVWHYTYKYIVDILESGVLLPPNMAPHFNDPKVNFCLHAFGKSVNKDSGYQADSKLLLFSQREDWEPASYRAIRVGVRVIELHRLQDYEAWKQGVYRIGVSRELLDPWIRLKRLCGMPPDSARGLEQYAREMGSNPYDWWGTMRPIPKDKWRSVEVYNPATKSWDALTGMQRIEHQSAPPVPGPTLAVDDQGNVVTVREVSEQIVPSEKPKSALVEHLSEAASTSKEGGRE